jgi:hypothetical protein
VDFRHLGVVDILPTPHRVGKVDSPIVAIIHVSNRRRNSALRHDGVSFTQERFANDANAHSSGRSFDRRPESCPAGANYKYIVFLNAIVGRHLPN